MDPAHVPRAVRSPRRRQPGSPNRGGGADRRGPRLLRRRRARALALSGDMWAAPEALRAGLVDQVVDHDTLLDEALALAGRIAANPAPQLQWTKHLLDVNAVEPDLKLIQERESELLRRCWASPEHAEAVKAFQEKRPPVFPPRPAVIPTS